MTRDRPRSSFRRTLQLLRRSFRRLGTRGVFQSLYHSRRTVGRPTGLFVSGDTVVQVDSDARFDVPGRFLIGYDPMSEDNLLRVENGGALTVRGPQTIALKSGSRVNVDGGDLEIGDATFTGRCEIHCLDRVTIGDGCGIGDRVVIRDGHPHTSFVDGASVPATAPVTVEDDVAIPGHAILKQGTTIGEGAIIATGSVVTRDVPPGTLVAGTPATVRKTNVDWDW